MHPGAGRTSRPNQAASRRRSRRLIPERFERLEGRTCLTRFSLTELPVLPGDTGGGYANGLNDAASIQVVGYSAAIGGPDHPILWHKDAAGSFVAQSLGSLGGPGGYAIAVNDSGQVVGRSDTRQVDSYGNPIHHAFSWQKNGVMTDLDTLGSPGSEAMAVSATGRVVGNFGVPPDPTYGVTSHAFVWEGGVMYDLNRLLPSGSGWVLVDADGVNATQIAGLGLLNGQKRAFRITITDPDGVFGKGVPTPTDLGAARAVGGMSPDGSRVVGDNVQAGREHATLWQGRGAIDLGSLGGGLIETDQSHGYRVNDSGQVVGVTDTKSYRYVPFLWQNGKMTDLNQLVTMPAGYELTGSSDINDASQIAGTERTATGNVVPVLLTPKTGPAKTMTTSAASLTDAKMPGLDTGTVDPLVLDDLAHWLTAGARAKRTQAVVPGA
jgi:probable HAF family extracellular repeat protein